MIPFAKYNCSGRILTTRIAPFYLLPVVLHTPFLSVSAFFPCFNDAGTIARLVILANETLARSH